MKKIRNILVLSGMLLATATVVFAGAKNVTAPAGAIPFFIFAPKEARVLFVGDMFFDRYIRQVMERRGGDFVFSCSDELLQSADLVVGNLEGPITQNPSVSIGTKPEQPENFHFTFPPETAELLAAHYIGAVNLGNNHSGNFGREGIASTKQYLDDAGVSYFSEGFVYRAELNDISLSFVSYNEFGGVLAKEVAEVIATEHAAGRKVFVYAHWGEEYVDVPARVRTAAELFANAGASVIIGSHPHVVLGHEYIGETLVYWSLGNFIFDQYWNKEVSRGLAVLLSISKNGVEVQEYPVEMLRDGRTCLLVE